MRTRSTASKAFWESGSTVIGTEMSAAPPLTAGGAGLPRSGMPVSAWDTWVARSALATTMMGWDASARWWAMSTFCPFTASNSLV